MTSVSRGDVVLVRFVFADEKGVKQRPALIVSTDRYHQSRREAVLLAITSNVGRLLAGDYKLKAWREAGLLHPSVITGIVRTIKQEMITVKLGVLPAAELRTVDEKLRGILGSDPSHTPPLTGEDSPPTDPPAQRPNSAPQTSVQSTVGVALMTDLDAARDEVSRSSAGGAPFLAVFGATLLACAVASLFVTRQQAALMVMFQGGLALPLAFLLERRLGSGRMADDNPLRPLSIQLAMSQIVAFPVVILVYSLNPGGVPLTMAAIAGGHFLPYAWLQRTRVYVWLAVAVSAGALAIQIALGSRAFPWVLAHMTLCYWIAAQLVYRAAAKLSRGPVNPMSAGSARRLKGPVS